MNCAKCGTTKQSTLVSLDGCCYCVSCLVEYHLKPALALTVQLVNLIRYAEPVEKRAE